jgi:hypothetical protein
MPRVDSSYWKKHGGHLSYGWCCIPLAEGHAVLKPVLYIGVDLPMADSDIQRRFLHNEDIYTTKSCVAATS